MIEITASKGLGDSIYLRAIVLHLLKTEEVTVFTRWPELFTDTSAIVRRLVDIRGVENMQYAAYCLGCLHPTVRPIDLFTRACLRAGVIGAELRIDWKPRNLALVKEIRRKAAGRKVLVYQPNKIASNDEQESLRPNRAAFNKWLDGKADYFRIKIGSPDFVERDNEAPCEMDLFGKTSVTDALDIGTVGDLFFGESCFVLVMAEAMDKQLVCMFSRCGLESPRARVSGVNPSLIFHKKHLATAVFD